MAVLFRIDATPGPSVFGAQGDFHYDRGVGDGPDTLYPAIYIADAMDIVGGRFALDTASSADWSTCGISLNPLGTTPGGGSGGHAESHFLNLNGPCYMEAVFHPTSTSLGDIFSCPLIWLSSPTNTQLFGTSIKVFGSDELEVFRLLNAGGSPLWSEANPDFTTSEHPVADQPYKVRLEWKCGTVSGSDIAADGWWKLIINDVEVTGQTDVDLYLSKSTSPFNLVGWAAVGFDGTLGPWDYFEIGSIDEEDDRTIPINESTPCCGDTVDPVTGSTVGSALPDNPNRPLLPWSRACAGGGTVPSASDLTDAEDWSV